MRTKEFVQKQIDETIKFYENQAQFKKKDLTKGAKKIALLKNIMLYLESGPKEEFVSLMLKQTEQKLKNINLNYKKWTPTNKTVKNLRAAYDTEMGTKKCRAEIQTLKYILELKD